MSEASPDGSTRDRLLAAAMKLFAERGYGRTTMGDIEEVAGFTRRGGTLYHYFPSKAAVLEAALDRHTDSVADIGGLARLLPLPDRHSELLLLAKWLLSELDRQRELVRFVEKEGGHLAEIRDRLSRNLVDAGYRWTAEYGRTLLDEGDWDLEALAVLFVGGLVNYRRTAWTFGRPPLDLPEDRLLTVWTRLALFILDTAAAQAHEEG
jgi:AcrR family transcriptional regulator